MKITIDNNTYATKDGQTIIEVADENNIAIPRFCYHKGLSVAANCRMCLVDVEGTPKPLPACATQVQDGMSVFTKSQAAVSAQQNVMQFLLINHPLDCPICDQGGECELQDVAMGFGAPSSKYQEEKRVLPNKDIGPLIQTEMTRCIHCTRCVRFGEEVAGIKEMGGPGRGEHTRITTFIENTIDSELSGNMIDLCPVGALTSKPFRYSARSWEMHSYPTVALHDVMGSTIEVHCKNNEVKRVVPRYSEINEYWLSDRDRFSYEGLRVNRLEKPRIKKNKQWEEVSWEEAFEFITQRIQSMTREERSQTAGLAGPNLTMEEYYLFQKFIRALGSNKVDYRLRQNLSLNEQFINDAPVLHGSLEDVEHRAAILVLGGFVQKQQPMFSQKLKKAAANGSAITVLDAQHQPYTYPVTTCALAPKDWYAFCLEILRNLNNAQDVPATTLDEDTKIQAATLAQSLKKAGHNSMLVFTGDAMRSQYADMINTALKLIAQALSIEVSYLAIEAGAVGAHLAGCVPFHTSIESMEILTSRYKQPIHLLDNQIYFLLCVDPKSDFNDPMRTQVNFENSDFVVSISHYKHSALNECSDVLLPASTYFETPGTHINAFLKWQSFDQISQHAQSKPIWKILRVLGEKLTMDDFKYSDFEQVHTEAKNNIHKTNETALAPNASQLLDPVLIESKQYIEVWMPTTGYNVDAMVRASAPLQRTKDAAIQDAFIHPLTLESLCLGDGVYDIHISDQQEQTHKIKLTPSAQVAKDCIVLWQRNQQAFIDGPSSGFYEVMKGGENE